MVPLLAIFAALATIAGGAVFVQLLRVWKRRAVLSALPAPPAASWFLGHLPQIMNDRAPLVVAEWRKQCGSVFRLRFLHTWMVIITDTRRAQQVMQKSSTYCPKNRAPYKPLEMAAHPATPNILTSSDGAYWREVRNAWMKCFTSVQLKKLYPTILQVCERQMVHLDAQGGRAPVNISRVAECITLDVIGYFAFDKDLQATNSKCSRYLELLEVVLQIMHQQTNHPLMLLLEGLSPQQKAMRLEWDALNAQLVDGALQQPPPDTTIAGQLLKVRHPDNGRPLSRDELKGELVIAMMAGFETTSNTLAWACGMLATHPQACSRLEQELAGAELLQLPGAPPPRPFPWSQLGRLPYLNAVIREVLRLFSPAALGSIRMVEQDITLEGGVRLPKGTGVMINLYTVGRNPDTYGPDADEFKPERWLSADQLQVVVDREQANSSSSTAQPKAAPPATAGGTGGGDGEQEEEEEQTEQQLQHLTGAEGEAARGGSPANSSNNLAAATNSSDDTGSKPGGVTEAGGGGSSAGGRLPDSLAFSVGPRDCAGQALARIELQVVLALLVGRYHLALAPEVGGLPGLLERLMYHLTLQIKEGLPMLLTPRA